MTQQQIHPETANRTGHNRAFRLMFLAGENSGDQHAARLIAELRKVMPEAEFFGFGGERMEAAGMRLDENLAQKMPLIGLTQVIRNYGKLKALLERARKMLRDEQPDALVLVDYPGFNLRLAETAKELGIPVIYFISPQVWAWHRSRIQKIAALVSKMLVIFPFEERIYREAGVPCAYVGHPLQDDESAILPRDEVLGRLDIGPTATVIGLLPGSRPGEIIRHLPIFLQSAELIQKELESAAFVLPRASTIPRELLDKYLSRHPSLRVRVAESDLKSVRASMDFAICKSGTSTLELALLGVPMVVVYVVSLPTYLFARAVVRIPWIGLVNIVANEEVAPELLQFKAKPPNIAATVVRLLRNPELMDSMRQSLMRVKSKIGSRGASRRAAEEIALFLDEARAQK